MRPGSQDPLPRLHHVLALLTWIIHASAVPQLVSRPDAAVDVYRKSQARKQTSPHCSALQALLAGGMLPARPEGEVLRHMASQARRTGSLTVDRRNGRILNMLTPAQPPS